MAGETAHSNEYGGLDRLVYGMKKYYGEKNATWVYDTVFMDEEKELHACEFARRLFEQ